MVEIETPIFTVNNKLIVTTTIKLKSNQNYRKMQDVLQTKQIPICNNYMSISTFACIKSLSLNVFVDI